MKQEKEYYEIIKTKLEELFKAKFGNCYLEITADGKFSNELKGQIPQHRDIIFVFLKKNASPDITGFVKEEYSTNFIIAEIKRDEIKQDDVYQARKYAELFDARYGFLISLQSVPEEIKRLNRVVYPYLLSLPAYKTLTLACFHEKNNQFTEWFPKNPFGEIR